MAVLLPPGCTPDQYGVVPEGQPLPRVIKKNPAEEELNRQIPADEPEGAACCLILIACGGTSGERSVGNVDSFRARILEMRRSHFSHKQKVDVLPVHWHEAHTEQATGAKNTLDSLTLPSVQVSVYTVISSCSLTIFIKSLIFIRTHGTIILETRHIVYEIYSRMMYLKGTPSLTPLPRTFKD